MGIYFDQKLPSPLQADTTVLAQALVHGLDVAHICKGHAMLHLPWGCLGRLTSSAE